MTSAAMLLLVSLSTAHAVPGQFTHQGRLLDADDLPMDGEVDATFRLVDGETGGAVVWEETLTLTLTNGFYAAVLGAEMEDNPLDVDVLDQAPLWLEIQLDGVAPMFPRHPINAVPYATMAGVAEEVSGGPVDASEVSIAGSLTIDAEGRWVGPTPEVSWEDIADIPAGVEEDIDTVLSGDEVRAHVAGATLDLGVGSTMDSISLATVDDLVSPTWEDLEGVPDAYADGLDSDTLASLEVSCTSGDVPHWDDVLVAWSCTEDIDTVLSSEEVEGYITDGAIDLASGTTLGGSDISTGEHTSTLDWSDIFGIPDDFADGTDADTWLSADDVIGYITDAAIDLASGTTLGGSDISTGPHTTTLGWGDIFGIPDDFADGTDDDSQLSADEVEGFITDGAIDLASGTTLGGADISTGEHSSSDDDFFGDGSDGDVTISGTTEVSRAMLYDNLTIESSGTLRTSASSSAFLVIFVADTLTIDGHIDMDGRGGLAGSGGTGNIGGYIGSGGEHGAGGGTSGTAGGDGNGSGQSGGDGKPGGSGGSALWHSGGGGGSLIPGGASPNDPRKNIPRYAASALPGMYGGGGSGGGGGGGGGGPSRWYAPGGDGGDGGDAGEGGGGIIISAKNIVVNSGGAISADGIDGTDGTDGTDGSADSEGFAAGGGGGGAGGGGGESGTIILIYTSLDNSGTITSSGGTGGAGGEGGSRGDGRMDGSDGSDGPTGDDGDSNSIISMDVSTGG